MILDKLDIKIAHREIYESKRYLENVLNKKIEMFCYPRGRYNREIIELVEEIGFLAARTAIPNKFELPMNRYEWGVSLFLSNGSPLLSSKMCISNKLSLKSFFDWEKRAKELFDIILKKGGIYHIYGHSSEIEKNKEWDKLESLFKYISNHQDVDYLSNGDIFKGFKQ